MASATDSKQRFAVFTGISFALGLHFAGICRQVNAVARLGNSWRQLRMYRSHKARLSMGVIISW